MTSAKCLIPSSDRRRIDGELNRQAKRWQSVTKLNESLKTVIEREKALSNSEHSARAAKNVKLFKNLRRSVTNYIKQGGLVLKPPQPPHPHNPTPPHPHDLG